MSVLEVSELNFFRDQATEIPTVKKIALADGVDGTFVNVDSVEKPIFMADSDPRVILATAEYPYAFASAISAVANNALTKNSPDKFKKKEPPTPQEPAVKNAIDQFREQHMKDGRYLTKKYVVQPATRYYSGRQGAAIGEAACFGELTDEDLLSIVNVAEAMKTGVRESLRQANQTGNNAWLKERVDYTPAGWREVETIKNDTLFNIGKISADEHNKKAEWIAGNSFAPGWNFKDKQETVVADVDFTLLSERAANAVDDFNKFFSLNAINKDNLYEA